MSYLEQAARAGAVVNGYMNEADADDHFPRSHQDLQSQTVGARILSAAVVTSGCDAGAYYRADGAGQFRLVDQLDLYDLDQAHPTEFPPTLAAFEPGTFAGELTTRATSEKRGQYHLPVRDRQGSVKGIVVLHPPQDGYMRIQNETEAQKDADWRSLPAEAKAKTSLPDMHEPVSVRMAKIEMAAHIVDGFKASLLERPDRQLAPNQDIGTRKERDTFLLNLAKDMFKTFPKKETIPEAEYQTVLNARDGEELRRAMRPLLKYDEAMQGAHVVGTADLMKYSVEALNNDTRRRDRVTRDEAETVELLAMLHDVGKSQFSYSFFRDWSMKGQTAEDLAEQKERNIELVEKNANHAYLDHAVLSLFPASAKMVADHHHGHHRYSEAELKQSLGDHVGEHVIATDPVAPEQVHMLSRMLRVADVTEAITARTSNTLADALKQLAEKSADFGKGVDGKPRKFADVMDELAKGGTPNFTTKPMDPNTIDMDALCFMIEQGVFTKYGAQRDVDEKKAGNPKGWVGDKGIAKYDAAEVEKAGKAILQAFHWDERRNEITTGVDGTKRPREATIREDVQDDPLLNPLPPASGRRGAGYSR